jgi:hypothetical protein
VSAPRLSRLVAFPLIFVFAVVIAVPCAALIRIHTELVWKVTLALAVGLLAFPPLLAVRLISWIGRAPATVWDAIVATLFSLAAVPLFGWAFRHSAHFVSGVTLPDKYVGFLRFLAFMIVVVTGIDTVRLTKRWS